MHTVDVVLVLGMFLRVCAMLLCFLFVSLLGADQKMVAMAWSNFVGSYSTWPFRIIIFFDISKSLYCMFTAVFH